MNLIKTICQICKNEIAVRNEKKKHSSVCDYCFNDRSKTMSLLEVDLSGVDKTNLTRLNYGNYIIFSKEEFDEINDQQGLTPKDILLLKESDKFFDKNETYRKRIIRKFCDVNNISYWSVRTDKYVDAFIKFGLHSYSTDKEFFINIALQYVSDSDESD